MRPFELGADSMSDAARFFSFTRWQGRLAASPEILRGRLSSALDRLVASLCDPARRERVAAKLVFSYALIWTLYDVVARSSQDIHYDMGEMIAWSHDLALGNIKHPQMGAWIAYVWFLIFPLRDWAFYLLANVMTSFAIWLAWRISEEKLSDEKRVLGLAFLTLIPFFNFFAWKYNANSILICLSALTTFWFLRSVETRRPLPSLLAGVAAAAAMMGKYWSIFLLIGLGVAALARADRKLYFRSPAPWVTIAGGILALSPHLYWLATHHFPSVEYAFNSHSAVGVGLFLWDLALYIVGIPGYFILPLLLIFIFARPDRSAIRDTLLPRSAERRFVAVAFWVPVLLPILAAFVLYVDMSALWMMSACTLLPLVLLSSPRLVVTGKMVRYVVAIAIVYSLTALVLLAPARALRIHKTGVNHFGTHYQLAAKAVEKEWRKTTDAPLKIFGSYSILGRGMAFYIPGRASMLNIEDRRDTPWVGNSRIDEDGAALVCPTEEKQCVAALDALAANHPAGRRVTKSLTRYYFGRPGISKEFVIVTIPPKPAK